MASAQVGQQSLDSKRQKVESNGHINGTRKIGTHSGTFHCDEVLGCWLLKQTEQFQNSTITRTRDEEILKSQDIIIDVGGEYSEDKLRFDHHQRGFDENFGLGFNTRLSSAGLVFKHYGRAIIQRLLCLDPGNEKLTNTLYKEVYKHFMEAIDANDNGILQFDTDQQPKFISNTSLPSRVGALNTQWNEEYSDEKQDQKFQIAMKMTGEYFLDSLNFIYKVFLPAKQIVQEAIDNRFEVHKSGKVVKFETPCPWKEHLFAIEEELNIQGEILYCLYLDKSWRLQCVPQALGKFDNRKSLPEPWRGLRNEELSKVSGIPDGIFVHLSGFTGGNKTYEGVLEMVSQAVEKF